MNVPCSILSYIKFVGGSKTDHMNHQKLLPSANCNWSSNKADRTTSSIVQWLQLIKPVREPLDHCSDAILCKYMEIFVCLVLKFSAPGFRGQ